MINKTKLNRNLLKMIIYISIIIILVIYLFPIIWEFSTSLKMIEEALSNYNLIPKKINFNNYIIAWTQFNVGRYLMNTVIVSVTICLGTIVSCSTAGYAFAQLRFPGKNFLFFLYLSTMMIPASITLIPSFFIIIKLNWNNTYLALIGPFIFGNAFGTFLLRQFYMTLPKDLSDSAKIDGAGFWKIWWNIMLPLSQPAMATLAVMTIVSQWNSFLWPLVVTRTQEIKVLSVGLSDFRLMRNIQWTPLMAAVMLASIPMIVILFVAQKYFIRGIQFSGVNR